MRILVIEDDPATAKLICEFSRFGDVIDVAASIVKAKQLISENDYAVVSVDLKLQDSEGIETLDRIHQFRPDLKLIVFSANVHAEVMAKCAALGARLISKGSLSSVKELTGEFRMALNKYATEDECLNRMSQICNQLAI